MNTILRWFIILLIKQHVVSYSAINENKKLKTDRTKIIWSAENIQPIDSYELLMSKYKKESFKQVLKYCLSCKHKKKPIESGPNIVTTLWDANQLDLDSDNTTRLTIRTEKILQVARDEIYQINLPRGPRIDAESAHGIHFSPTKQVREFDKYMPSNRKIRDTIQPFYD